MRTIGVVTVARSDYGLYRPILRELAAHPDLTLHLIVGGMHLSEEFGSTVGEIEQDGFAIADRVATPLESDAPAGIAAAIGFGIGGFAQSFARTRPDLLLVLGDRYEMLAAVTAALPFALPVAHVHGGESTEGLIDEGIRHAITKMSHVHFAATELYARRIVQMGEEPWRVHVSGAPGLDAIRELTPVPKAELERLVGLPIGDRSLLVTYHPVTLEYEHVERDLAAFLEALDSSGFDLVFTAPNADTNTRTVTQMIQSFIATRERAVLTPNLGSHGYLSMLGLVRGMVGNSSSGIIEAASFKLPVVNVGTRQQGRVRPRNVIDAGHEPAAILDAIRRATSDEFRASLADLQNPYGDGHAAERIVATLAAVPLDRTLIVKRFHDLQEAAG